MIDDKSLDEADSFGLGIAVIGYEGRFPKSPNSEAFWENLIQGNECISFFDKDELLKEGIDSSLIDNPDYVPARGVIDDVDRFDASFFDYSPNDAALMDPQQRLFMETAWKALENAGYGNVKNRPRTGVFASSSTNTYLMSNILSNPSILETFGRFQIQILNQFDALATQTSYKLNLTGPSLAVQTACSSSLVGIHIACQSLLNGECDLGLAGAVSIRVPHKEGYLYQSEGIASPDGRCRPFDEESEGTVSGNGVGVVILKRLDEALEDGDDIKGIIRGTALNNDGSHKVGFTAPSLDGQAEVIAEAMAIADCDFRSISYTEAHGSGTLLGDPIEVAALTKAHRTENEDTAYCRLGAVKSNIGHLDAAAGIAGLIKILLSMKHGKVPPTLHSNKPNPRIDFENSPFLTCSVAEDWSTDELPRRAGLSSFGIGGTNTHIVLEEPPVRRESGLNRSTQLIPLSAKSVPSLQRAAENLRSFFESNRDVNIADAAYTLSVGRQGFSKRRMAVVGSAEGAINALGDGSDGMVFDGGNESSAKSVVFMFPGQGSQYVNMGRGLYESEPDYKEAIDRCSEILIPLIGEDIRKLLFRDKGSQEDGLLLNDPRFGGPVLFTVEYALTTLWKSWGVNPSVLIGHSLGEYVAACVADIFTLEDALHLVALRGRLMKKCASGSMLVVACTEEALLRILPDSLDIASINSKESFTVSGNTKDVDAFSALLIDEDITHKKMDTTLAYHSRMMDPVLDEFLVEARKVSFKAPQIPIVSSSTSDWLSEEQACDPAYWARHIRETVRFYEGACMLVNNPANSFLEIGPLTFTGELLLWGAGDTRPLAVSSLPNQFMEVGLKSFAEQMKQWRKGKSAKSESGEWEREKQVESQGEYLQKAIANLWVNGCEIDWDAYYDGQRRNRVSLPGYSFADQRFWIDPVKANSVEPTEAVSIRIDAGSDNQEDQDLASTGELRSRPSLSSAYLEPSNETEQAIAGILSAILGISNIGIRDDFFELGGDSLKGVRLVSQLKSQLNICVSLEELYSEPTIEGLSGTVGEVLEVGEDDELESLLNEVEGLSEEELLAALGDASPSDDA
ncbi:acyltransferase domain-containing protein [Puniceicoccaceae bacterium K14]|nr:acyltransferase domain-containing protein [Puniceicoccaceae bacterium K14]